MSKSQAWTLHTDEQGIAWLHLDVPDKGANVLSQAVVKALGKKLDEVEKSDAKGLIIISDKKAGFIAGADVEEFTHIKTTEEAKAVIALAHGVFNRLEGLNIPTLSLIHGHCLGGGLELSLACDYRIAEHEASLGFPEVMLGIFPGFGGSVRSIRLLGVQHAMTMMLTGRPVSGKRAKRIGLVDETVPQRQLKRAAVQMITQAARHRVHQPSMLQKVLRTKFGRKLVAMGLRKMTRKRVNPKHYPAPFALIDMWARLGGNDKRMFQAEMDTVSKLLLLPQTQNLVRLFFLQDRLKSFGKESDATIHHIHVIGAGVMGGDIAAWCAMQGIKVTLQDQDMQVIAKAIKRAAGLFQKKLRQPRLVQAALDRLIPDLEGLGIAEADMVLEAIVENLEIKQSLYQSIEPKMKQGAVLATNTSGIPMDDLATVLAAPERLVGIHFFNPVAKMKLVETIAGKKTAKETLAVAHSFVTQIRKLPLPVKSSPGFLVNRILMPYLMEAVNMVDEGKQPECIDKAATDFGMPMGPITLADTVGLDICWAVAQDLADVTGDKVPKFLQTWVEQGRLGKKSGQGFYRYNKGKPVMSKANVSSKEQQEITDRLITRIVDEAKRCLDEGVVEDADLLDAGMVFGTGFAPFRGGVMKYAKDEGKL